MGRTDDNADRWDGISNCERQIELRRPLSMLVMELERKAVIEGKLPRCMVTSRSSCTECIMEDEPICPVKADADFRSLLLYRRDQQVATLRKRARQIETLKRILTNHKLPIHWENLSVLALREDPVVFKSPDTTRALVSLNRDVFCFGEDGVVSLVR